MKIFLVDDNPEAVELLSLALERAGYETAVAYNGSEALAMIPQAQPDVVVVDVMMPDLSGFQVTRELRSHPETTDIPIILLTARTEIENKLEGFGAGADDYLTKPVLPAELIVRINALNRRARRYALAAQPKGRIIGFLGVKGGVGTTTLAVNTAIALATDDKNVILVDLNRWASAVALQMGISPRAGLVRVAEKEPSEITRRLVENSLESHRSGVKVLAMPHRGVDDAYELSAEQIATTIEHLETLADAIVLDLGSGLSPDKLDSVKRCHLTVVVLEADAVALSLAGEIVSRLESEGILGSSLGLVVVNRSRSASMYTRSEIEEQLGCELLGLITPAPEISFHASKVGTPVLLSQPDTAIASQFKQLSTKVA